MTNQTDGRLRLQLDFCFVRCNYYKQKKLTLNGFVSYFMKNVD